MKDHGKLIHQAALALALALSAPAMAEPLSGKIGSREEARWQSSWIDLTQPTDFRKGDVLVIRLSGGAQLVKARLLPAGSRFESSDGLERGTLTVPADGVLELALQSDHPRVIQVSVHAGREAWGEVLGETNGRVRLVAAERKAR